jgi:predicted TIM-barrel fold metal-dependent hydrolase
VPEPPSSYFGDHIFCSFFDDAFGIANLERIGVDNVMFESDYPHQDTNWPNCLEEGERQTSHLAADQKQKILRENALRLLTPA